MKGNPAVVRKLNEVLTNELTAINQYFVHAKMFAHWGFMRLGKREHDASEQRVHQCRQNEIRQVEIPVGEQRTGHSAILPQFAHWLLSYQPASEKRGHGGPASVRPDVTLRSFLRVWSCRAACGSRR